MGARYSPEVLGDGGDGGGIGSHCEGVGVVADKGEVGGGRAYAVGVAQDAEAVNAVSDVEIDFLGGAGIECLGGTVTVEHAAIISVCGDAADVVDCSIACRCDGHTVDSVDDHGAAGAVDVVIVGSGLVAEVGSVVVGGEGGITINFAYDGAFIDVRAVDASASV